MRGLTLPLLFAVNAACSAGASGPPARTAVGDRAFVEFERHDTVPEAELGSGDAHLIALEAESGREPARQAALAFVRALLAADAIALQQMLAEDVAYGVESAARPRAELVERCIGEARALRYGADTTPESVIDIDAIEVRRVANEDPQLARPPGILASDLIVTLPPRALGGAPNFARIPCLNSLYVRLGDPTRVVGLIR